MENNQACPCGGGYYQECCLPLHEGKVYAENAQQLMRSRYSAFVKQKVDYIVKTTAKNQQHALDISALMAWSKTTEWKALEVLNYRDNLDKNHASVEFKAYYWLEGATCAHHENSFFVKHLDQWYFLDPTLEEKYTMKQPCICGSNKKFKLCCAKYL